MATVIAEDYGEGRELFPMRYIADLFKEQTLKQLKINMMTQRVWPFEVYPGYRVVNQRRDLLGGWYLLARASILSMVRSSRPTKIRAW